VANQGECLGVTSFGDTTPVCCGLESLLLSVRANLWTTNLERKSPPPPPWRELYEQQPWTRSHANKEFTKNPLLAEAAVMYGANFAKKLK